MLEFTNIQRIAEVEFADIVKSTHRTDYKLRVILIDGSFIDVNLSTILPDKFGFHWECMDTTGTIYRYDNFPDKSWQLVTTFPYHFHNGHQDRVITSTFPLTIIDGFRAFMEFVRKKIKKRGIKRW